MNNHSEIISKIDAHQIVKAKDFINVVKDVAVGMSKDNVNVLRAAGIINDRQAQAYNEVASNQEKDKMMEPWSIAAQRGMGVSGWFCIPLSLSSTLPTKR